MTTVPPSLDKLLDRCVAAGAFRYNIGTSWVLQGFRYATDGRILVRVPSTEPDEPEPEKGRQRPDVLAVWRGNFSDQGVTLSDPGPLRARLCEDCNGFGTIQFGTNCDDLEDCGCRQGVVLDFFGVQVGDSGVWISDRYARLLHAFGATLYPQVGPKCETKAVKFVVGEAEGRLMPVDCNWSNAE